MRSNTGCICRHVQPDVATNAMGRRHLPIVVSVPAPSLRPRRLGRYDSLERRNGVLVAVGGALPSSMGVIAPTK
ncbi:hypothetical protein GCM10009780_04300 [Actinomadura alba]